MRDDDMTETMFIVEEYDPGFPFWEEVENFETKEDAYKAINTYERAWPDFKWRIVKMTREILYQVDD